MELLNLKEVRQFIDDAITNHAGYAERANNPEILDEHIGGVPITTDFMVQHIEELKEVIKHHARMADWFISQKLFNNAAEQAQRAVNYERRLHFVFDYLESSDNGCILLSYLTGE